MDILTLVRSRPAGFGGHGTMHGPVIGRLLAAMMAGRPDPTIDISSLRPHRPVGAAEEWMVATRKDRLSPMFRLSIPRRRFLAEDDHLVDEVGSQDRSHVVMVHQRVDLDDVEALTVWRHQPDALEHVPRAQAARLVRAGPRCKRRIDDVDVEGPED